MVPIYSLESNRFVAADSPVERARQEQAFYERHANDGNWLDPVVRAAIVPAMTLGVAALVFFAHHAG